MVMCSTSRSLVVQLPVVCGTIEILNILYVVIIVSSFSRHLFYLML